MKALSLIPVFVLSSIFAQASVTLKCEGRFDKLTITMEASGADLNQLKLTKLNAATSLIEQPSNNENQNPWEPRRVAGKLSIVNGKISIEKSEDSFEYPYWPGAGLVDVREKIVLDVTIHQSHFDKTSSMACDLFIKKNVN